MRALASAAVLIVGLGLAPTDASAEVPLPSFETHQGIEAWLAVNAHIERASSIRAQADPDRSPQRAAELRRTADAELRLAVDTASAYETQVRPTSGLAYLKGLSWRLLEEPERAKVEWQRSIELDPVGAIDAYHDLGELLMTQKDWTGAEAAFKKVSEGVPDGPQAWRGPLRLAEVAAWQGDKRGLETWLTEALRRGYQMTWIKNEPQWKVFYADERLRRTVEKMVVVYGERSLLE
ncbi:MAG: tetratricopeptide repeat protein [Myxococcota bacterium]